MRTKRLRVKIFFVGLLFSFQVLANSNVIPLTRSEDGHLLVKATINGITADFILDTGATGTLIESDKLSRFGIEIEGLGFNGVRVGDEKTGNIETFEININSFALGVFKSRIKTIYSHQVRSPHASNIVGVIGQDVLIELHTLLDVSKPALLVIESIHNLDRVLTNYSNSEYSVVDLNRSAMGFSYINATFDQHQVKLIVDSGASQTVFDEQTLKALGVELHAHPSATTMVEAGVEIPMKQVRSGQLQVGDVFITDNFLTTDFSALMQAINTQAAPKFVGVMGLKEMQKLNALVDLKSQSLLISP